MAQLLKPTTTKHKIPDILIFSIQNYICEVVKVKLAPVYHLLFVQLVKFRKLLKDNDVVETKSSLLP